MTSRSPRDARRAAVAFAWFAVAAAAPLAAHAQNIPVVRIAVGPAPGAAATGAAAPVRVTSAPPAAAPMDIARGPAPAPNSVWVPGSWSWNGGSYGWSSGQWSMPPNYGARWIAPRWERREGYVLYYPGYWSNTGAMVQPYAPSVATLSGTLSRGLPMTPMGAFYNDYAVPLVAGQTVTFVVRGGASWNGPGPQLDPLVQLYGGGTLLAEDDDGAGGQDSRIVFTAGWSGTFMLRVTSYGAGPSEGTYTLTAQSGAMYGGPYVPAYGVM